VSGLNGARFLDAQSVDHILKNVVLGKHFDVKMETDMLFY